MSTYKELIYIVSDLAKQQSDDTTLTERHIAFLLNKYRSYLLKQKYLNSAQEIPLSNYQTICADLTLVPAMAGCTYEQCMAGDNSPLLRSIEKVDLPLTFSDTKVSLLKCKGSFSLNLYITTTQLQPNTLSDLKFIKAKDYEYISTTFNNTYMPIYKEGDEWMYVPVEEIVSEVMKAAFPDGMYVQQLFVPQAEDYEVQYNILYNKRDNTYIMAVVDNAAPIPNFLPYLPLRAGDIYITDCSEDAQQLINILAAHDIVAKIDAVLTNGECNETMFYTNAMRQFNGILVVDRERFNYVGHSKYYRSNGYATIGIDNHLYVKSDKDLSAYAAQYNTETGEAGIPTGKALITAIFENPDKAYEHSSCTYDDGKGGTTPCPQASSEECDPWDRQFPIEDALQTQLIALVLKDIYGGSLRPKDRYNNANDDLSSLETFIRNAVKNSYLKNNAIDPDD